MTDLQAANRVVGNRVGPKSKVNYRGKLNTIKIYLISREDRHALLDGNNDIVTPMEDEVMKSLFGWLSKNTDLPRKKRNDEDQDEDEDEVHGIDGEEADAFANNRATISHSCMQGYKSALVWHYAEKGQTLDPLLNSWCDNFINGYKKTVADKKSRGVMAITEGKAPLSFSGYSHICRFLATLTPTPMFNWQLIMFSWLFMVLCWNLIGRSNTVGSIMLQHMDMGGDCVKIKVPKHKGDQTGEGMGNDKHVYANPYNPVICPMLSLAVFIFCKYRGADVVRQQLFDGNDSENRFGKALMKVLKNIRDLYPNIDLGAVIEDLGTHSNRKGVASYLLSMFFLSAVNVYLRAGWSLGNVQDRYIFAGAGGDQIVGRAASGLPITDLRFAVLPPHFSNEDLEILNSIGWHSILPGYNNYPSSFKRIVPFLLASLVHHSEWLKEFFPIGHPLFNQPLYVRTYKLETNGVEVDVKIMQYFKDKVLLGQGRCERTNLQATGIPDHLAIAAQIQKLEDKIVCLEDYIRTGLRSEIISAVESQPLKVKSMLMENFQINGVVPLNISDIERIIIERDRRLFARLDEIQHIASNPVDGIQVGASQVRSFITFHWGGRMRMVPENFEFPKFDVKTMFILWHFGNTDLQIQPYKMLARYRDDLSSKQDQTNFDRARVVMHAIDHIAVDHNALPPGINDFSTLNATEAVNIFDRLYDILVGMCYGGGRAPHKRPNDLTLSTIAAKLYKLKKQRVNV